MDRQIEDVSHTNQILQQDFQALYQQLQAFRDHSELQNIKQTYRLQAQEEALENDQEILEYIGQLLNE